MIFLTVGTERFPFDRLVKAVDEIALGKSYKVFMQIGKSNYIPKSGEWARFLSFEEIKEKINNASIVISHAGAGSIILIMQLGKVPIIVPRYKKLGEHIDDHQIGLATQLNKNNVLPVFFDIDDLKRNFNKLSKRIEPKLDKDKNRSLSKYLNEIIITLK
jgi:UDP-N-acetylglucosamine transferase subunit ALG13